MCQYQGTKIPVHLKCKRCGFDFWIRPIKHLVNTASCRGCGRLERCLSHDEFVRRAQEVHGDKYDYTLTMYRRMRERVVIMCRICEKSFRQFPQNHLVGKGCGRCVQQKHVSVMEAEWLDRLHIPLEHRQAKPVGVYCTVDALVGNVVYEFYGTYFHGDPRRFAPDVFNVNCNRTMGELYERTLAREARLKALGYEIKFVWESDYENGLSFSPRHPHECLVNTTETSRESELAAR